MDSLSARATSLSEPERLIIYLVYFASPSQFIGYIASNGRIVVKNDELEKDMKGWIF
jgi:hypothetical protein